ncbi:nuclear transport factor 2 family protein [Bacillus sp. 2205SS5-2]|uniref:nuclear transport factor 2 family protein n=1 Tax=Bacillus sp. 2205SS5-2 TaxID=3109031 RepID=UPI003005981E
MEEIIIYEYEERLRKAGVNGDVENLDRLISDDLSFVSPVGQITTKEDDIVSHRSGILNITEFTFYPHVEEFKFSRQYDSITRTF